MGAVEPWDPHHEYVVNEAYKADGIFPVTTFSHAVYHRHLSRKCNQAFIEHPGTPMAPEVGVNTNLKWSVTSTILHPFPRLG